LINGTPACFSLAVKRGVNQGNVEIVKNNIFTILFCG
jgi:hypothetical protein